MEEIVVYRLVLIILYSSLHNDILPQHHPPAAHCVIMNHIRNLPLKLVILNYVIIYFFKRANIKMNNSATQLAKK